MTRFEALRTVSFAALAAAAVLLLWNAAPAAPQQPQPPAQDPQEPVIRVGVEIVNVFATVRDRDKRLVPNLTREQFRVFEDGQEQKIEYFSRETALPITLGLLIDTSISMRNVLLAEQDAASQFLRQVLRKEDLAFIASFDVNVDLLHDFTGDVERLDRAVRRAVINSPLPDGPVQRTGPIGTKLFDAIWLACREKLRREVGRKALVVLTDAVDAGSRVRLEDALEAAQRTDAVIYIIGIYDPQFYGRGFGYDGPGTAKKLAEETGGRAYFFRDERKLAEAFDEIAEELRTQYQLGYYPQNRLRDGRFRRLKVETTVRGHRIQARKGYYAPKE
jgi:VWFA-related protein